jgi:hypothetical protein
MTWLCRLKHWDKQSHHLWTLVEFEAVVLPKDRKDVMGYRCICMLNNLRVSFDRPLHIFVIMGMKRKENAGLEDG